MELQTISQITKAYHVTTRTLRYYEQIGLIKSEKTGDYAYRMYSENTVRRIEQILILRKLRIPLKQIAVILDCKNTTQMIDAFCQTLVELDDEISALSTIRDVVSSFIAKINDSLQTDSVITLDFMDDTTLLEAVDSLVIRKKSIKSTPTVQDLQNADKNLSKLTDRDVRILYLPDMTVASIHMANGEGAEQATAEMLNQFIVDSNLKQYYPAARCFGFNNPDGVPDNDPTHGYERWISIPNDLEIHAPFVKKRITGGIYAAYMIPMGAWDAGWRSLHSWVCDSAKYDFRWNTVEGVCGWLEEQLNYWSWDKNSEQQFDLLMPIQLANKSSIK